VSTHNPHLKHGAAAAYIRSFSLKTPWVEIRDKAAEQGIKLSRSAIFEIRKSDLRRALTANSKKGSPGQEAQFLALVEKIGVARCQKLMEASLTQLVNEKLGVGKRGYGSRAARFPKKYNRDRVRALDRYALSLLRPARKLAP
jgi:hypothetical protein